ncbi:hypothetical protein Emed_001724 [Eimeria media]
MRLFQNEHVFLNDWGSITAAFWVKYPNELQPHVLRVDTLDLQIDEENQQFVCRRLLSLKYQCPKWVQKFFGASPVGFAIEEATCSLKERKLTLRSCNYTFASFFRVEEACEYTPHPDNPQHTLYRQTATYKVSGLGLPVNRAVENAAVAQAKEKSLLGVSVVERMGSFVAEQQWLRSCSNCLQSLEEVAADASKQAQEKYRRLKQRVEQKLGVAANMAADLEQSEGDYPRVVTAAESSEEGSATGRFLGTDSQLAARVSHSNKEDTSDASAQAVKMPNDLFLAGRAVPRWQSTPQATSSGEEGGGDSQDGSPPPPETEAEADCPCRQPTPAGRLPAPTSVWSNMRRQAVEKAALLHPPVAPYCAASSSGAPRSGTLDLAFVGRDVAGAAQCQQQQQQQREQHQRQGTHEATWGWRGNALFSFERPEVVQEDAANRRRPVKFGPALLLSSLVGTTRELQ